MSYLLLWTLSVGCSQKSTSPATPINILEDKQDEDCPEAVKISCNVPDMTEAEMKQIYEANQQCVAQCVQSKQAESVSADMIQQDCRHSCDEQFFVGQVEVVPVLPAIIPEVKSEEEPKLNSTNSEPTE